jgi:DNA repair protein RecO (recombination protein O)
LAQVNVSGIVLQCYDLGEKDRIVVLLTAELGKIRVVAKGAKRPGGRFAAVASPFTEITASIHLGRSLHTLNQAQIRTSHRQLREQLDRMAIGLFMTELLDVATVEGPGQMEFLNMLSNSLQRLEVAAQPELILCSFLLQLLQLSGLSPAAGVCASCQSSDRPLIALDAAAGGLVCRSCVGKTGSFPLSGQAIHLLNQLSLSLWEGWPPESAPVGPATILSLCRALEQFTFYQLDARPKSYRFLNDMRGTSD